MTNPPNWVALCAPGTIVSFRFPHGEDGQPGKVRPCLVIATMDTHGLCVTVAYGTTAATDANRGVNLTLDAVDDWQSAGLHRATRFVFSRRVIVSPRDPRFDGGASANPVIGSLPGHRQEELDVLVRSLGNRLHEDFTRGLPPERAERGRSRRGPYRRSRDSARSTPVVIERRQRKIIKHPASAG